MSDDADDDPQLKSLRAVWLAMPDEEPPERGLAELMAAARVKAEAMAKPSWWQRIVALLRRPPVFALATIMILIGGGLFIAQRRDKLETSGPAVQEVARDQPGAAGSASGPMAIEMPPAQPALEYNAEHAPEPQAAPSDVLGNGVKTDPGSARTNRRPAPAPDVKSTGSRGATTSRTELDGRKDDARDKSAEKLQIEDREEAQVTASDRFASPPPEPKVTAPKAEASGGESVGGGASSQADSERPATTSTSTGSTARPSRAPQYIAQAKSAAARGDCSAARLLMKRVASEDAAAYRTALANDASLKKCVAAN